MKRAALIYNIIIISSFLGASLITAKSVSQVAFTFLFVPPLIYFLRLLVANFKIDSPSLRENSGVTPERELILSTSHSTLDTLDSSTPTLDPEIIADPEVGDINRRLFLKLIGGAGISVFMMSLFTDKAHASFFGSMPVPGAMTVKDSQGALIDPAEKQPTDGYEISEIDDATSPAYYGFVHKTGAWYISREESNGSYRYAKGPTDFPGGWALRATLVYDYFDNTF